MVLGMAMWVSPSLKFRLKYLDIMVQRVLGNPQIFPWALPTCVTMLAGNGKLMQWRYFNHQKSGNTAEIVSQSNKRYTYEELRQIIPAKCSNRSPSILFPARLFREYGNPLALWLYSRYYDRQDSGKAIIDLVKCSQELQISVSTIATW